MDDFAAYLGGMVVGASSNLAEALGQDFIKHTHNVVSASAEASNASLAMIDSGQVLTPGG